MAMPRAGLLVLCLLCVARTSEMHPAEIADFEEGSLTHDNLSGIPVRGSNGTDKQSADKLREKRALGLLLSGLAQIFGYTVTPIQIASLTNPNITSAAAMPNSTMTPGNAMKQQAASSRPPATMNTTASRRQETIRFTGVLNFGNNSDIIGHLQRYEQIFHGNGTSTSAMTTSKPAPTPASNTSMDPRMNSRTKAPLLAPFFVKIPLPIAPNLPPATMPIADFKVSYPLPVFSVASGTNENAETPVRKEQETVYRNNEDTERYTVQDKDIYDEKDVSRPASKYNHELYIDDPNYNRQQDDRYDEVQHKQQEHVERLMEQEEQRNRDKDAYYKEDEVNERYRNREEEIDNRNREYAPKHEPKEENRPEYDDEADENSAEGYEEHANQANGSGESKRPTEQENEQDKTEGYSNYNPSDNPHKQQFDGYKYPDNLEKYIQVDYNRELPIGDYFHDGNPEVIRDSYGEVLDNKKLEDDRLSGYFSMFKQPYSGVYDSQRVRNPDDTSTENERQTSAARHGYEEHLDKLQKLREEYALPVNKYEEYDINDESEADRDDRRSERIHRNRTTARSGKPDNPADRAHSAEDGRARTPTGRNGNEVSRDDAARSEDANSREQIDFLSYTPLIVPVRYIDASDKLKEATTQRGSNVEDPDRSAHSQFPEDNADSKVTLTVARDNLALPIGLPARPQQLHEDERKELQIWPPPFDHYVYDNTEPVNAVVPPNPPHGYPPNYQHVVKSVAANDASNDNAGEPPAGYVVVLGDPVHPYRYPYNVYYFPNEAVHQTRARLSAEGAHSQDPVYVPQQSVNQRFVQAPRPNITEPSNLNETARDYRDYYYYRPQQAPINHLDRYRYVFEERTSEESPNVDVRGGIITGTDNWSSRLLHRPRDETIELESSAVQLQNVVGSTVGQRDAQNKSADRSRYSQSPRRRTRKNSARPEQQRKDDGEASVPSRQSTRRSEPPLANAHGTPDDCTLSLRKVDDNSFAGESSNVSRITQGGNSRIAKKSSALGAPAPAADHRDDESPAKRIDEPERSNVAEKANVMEYRNKATTLRMSQHSRARQPPSGSPRYVNLFMRDT